MKRNISMILCLLSLAGTLAAQSTFGTILGTVTDKTGAVVPAARVVITNQGENISRAVEADAQGNYEALNLKAGVYTVAAEAQGFKKFSQTDLNLVARQTLRVDVVLEVGQITEAISVEATAAVVNTETQTITATFDNNQVMSLPVNYRGAGSTSPLRLVAFMSGVQGDDGNINRFSIQGALPHQTEVTLDGISTVSVRNNNPLQELFPSVEGIAEMKVQGVGNNAEYGQVADITTTSRGGTNLFHGSAFEYMQNRAFDATAFGSVTKPQKTANTFGGSFGGPVRRNRTFFFADYEEMQFRRGVTIQATVPTALMRSGDLSRERGTVSDPLTKQPFPGNRIPAAQINGIGPKILQYYPTMNFGSNLEVQSSGNFRENRAAPRTSRQFDVRMDHMLTGKQSVFTRYTWKNQNEVAPNALLLPADDQYNDSRSVVVSHSYTLTPRTLNEFRIGFSGNDAARSYLFDGRKIVEGFGFQGLGPFPFNGLTGVAFSGATSNFGKSKAPFTYSRNFQFNDHFNWTVGRHTMKFGFDAKRLRAASDLNFFGEDDYGRFSFNGSFSGNDFGDFLLGLPYLTQLAKTGMDTDGLSWHWALYAQDSFKVSRKLTLEFGLRWEYHPPFTDAAFNITNFDRSVPRTGRVIIPSDPLATKITAPGFLLSINSCPGAAFQGIPCTPFLTAKDAGYPEQLRFPDKNNFNPRLGFAYRPFSDNRTVIRGGFGVYTMTILGSVFYSLTGVHGSDIRDFPNSIQSGQPLYQWPRVSTGGSGVGTTSYGSAYFGTANDPHFKDPYGLQWSFTVEREIAANTGARLSYVGLRSVQLPWSPDLNQPQSSTTPYASRPLTDRPFPYWGRIYSRDTGGNSIYNEFQTEVSRRMRGGLNFNSAWTWAKNLSDAAGPAPGGFSDENGGGRVTNSLDRRADRGNVALTRRHRWITTAIYELPFGKGKRFMSKVHPLAEGLLGGWRISSILLFQTGPFLTPIMSGGDPSGTNGPTRGSQRPDVLRDGNLENPTADRWFDRDAFICPGRAPGPPQQWQCNISPIGRFGNAGVGTLLGPGTLNLSMGFAKDFPFNERTRLRFEASFSNLPNHPNLGNPGTNMTSNSFGVITAVRGADSGGNRVGQFGLRLDF